MTLVICPPQGWLYGFPKALPEPEPADIDAWLIENGYPEHKVRQLGEDMFCRIWEEPNE